MALRTFRSNPSLGGFGSGEADGDAFCQIVKELVDNAVDACAVDITSSSSLRSTKRVRVAIDAFVHKEPSASQADESISHQNKLLRVTVSDNGIGMKDIQACVDPFSTSKAHDASRGSATNTTTEAALEQATAGRYGIGLTLCLLHAQRLIPDSSACIKSATSSHSQWTQLTCVVDTDHVQCIRRDHLPKAVAGESGTSISVLVPGGETAALAWPRLAEYFARFKLSLGLPCSLEVLAPTLSTVPLFVRPLKETTSATITQGEDDDDEEEESVPPKSTIERQAFWKAVQRYLGLPVDLRNVAHSVVPIRFQEDSDTNAKTDHRPMLEVALVVHDGVDDDEGEDDPHRARDEGDGDDDYYFSNCLAKGDDCGKMVLIRMVNRVPLLDSSERVACGFVQGLASKKRLWNSFGLDVSLECRDDYQNDAMKLPTYHIRDSDKVAPFFQRGTHAPLADDDEEDDEEEDSDLASGDGFGYSLSEDLPRKRKRGKPKRPQMLPAKVRLAHCVCVLHIHAKPTELPLPTLSKGRLPLDNAAINTALEVGLAQCLRQLQTSNPGLLLTPSELRVVERDFRYVPALASAIASIASKLSRPNQELLDKISRWKVSDAEDEIQDQAAVDDESSSKSSSRDTVLTKEQIEALVESRLRFVVAQVGKKTKAVPQKVGDDGVISIAGGEDVPRTQSVHSLDDLLDTASCQADDNALPRDSCSKDSAPDGGHASDGDYDNWL